MEAAVAYTEGVPAVVDLAKAALTNIVKSTFEYRMYNNTSDGVLAGDAVYPT